MKPSTTPSPRLARTSRSRRSSKIWFARAVLFGLPVVLWMGVILVFGAGENGRYERSLFLLQYIILYLAPDMPYTLDNGKLIQMSMYQLNAAFRRLSHVVVYAILTLLIVRLLQGGRSRLRPASLIVAALLSVVYIGVDEWKRFHEAHRHAKWGDLSLDLIGITLVLGGTVLYFALKEWERRLVAETDGSASA